MKCHYEVLGVARNASDVDIKKAYKKLALRWHPDKNLDNPEEAKEQFQVIQQAWDVLSDPRERAWYDDHREAILRGAADENYQDNAINLFQYFSTTCFKGYGDDEKGFYTIYRKVFETLAAEDAEFALEEDIDEDVPGFGDSQSSYEDVVHNFYAYWQSYRTKRSYSWLDPYGFQDASNRRVLRIIERENKKVRDKAKRERNEQVRNLVAFVRKRDKRVQAHAAKLAEKAKVNLKKTEERRKQQLLERQRQLKEHTESEWSKFSNMEAELKNIEANLDKEFGQDSLSDNYEEEEEKVETNGLYCVACNKLFKTQKAFANHENSKKHKDNVAAIKSSMIEEDEDFESDTEEDDYDSDSASVNDSPALATDSQMPDFLLNPEPNPSSTNYMDAEDSEEELMSDDEGSESQEKPVQKKSLPEGVKLAEGPQMDDALYHSPTTEDEEDITSDEELLSDQEDEVSEADNLIRGKKKRKKIPASVASRIAESSTSNSACQNISKSSSQSLADDKPGAKRLKKSRVKKLNTAARQKETEENDSDEKSTETSKSNTNNNWESGKKRRDRKTKETKIQKQSDKGTKSKNKNSRVTDVSDLTNRCFTCNKEFSSRNKLFEHLKRAGHCLLINEMNRVRGQEDVGKSQKAQKGVAT